MASQELTIDKKIKSKLKRCSLEVDGQHGKYVPYIICVDSIYGKKKLKPETYNGVRITFTKDGEDIITKFQDKRGQRHWLRFSRKTKEQAYYIAKRVINLSAKTDSNYFLK